MPARLSPRLAAIVDALPLQPHSRVIEIGCGPGGNALPPEFVRRHAESVRTFLDDRDTR